MVFRWLFGSSSDNRSQPPPLPSPEVEADDEYAIVDDRLGPNDSTPVATTDLTSPLQVHLDAIPPEFLIKHPEFTLSSYDLSKGQYARNVLALVHNAVRVEIAEMGIHVIPSLEARFVAAPSNITQEDSQDMRSWWSGFARFALTSSLVEDFVTKKAFDDVYLGYDKETKAIHKLYQKFQEKNNVYLEMAFRKMETAVTSFEEESSVIHFQQLTRAWEVLSSLLAEIYSDSENLIANIDKWIRNPFEYKDLEKQAAKIFTNKKRWGDDDSKRGEMIIMLCRWMNSEDLMREWMFRNLTKKELKFIDRWLDNFERRLVVVNRFHQKCPK